MDPMDSIGTTFNPLYNMSGHFSKSLTNRKYTFPMDSIRVQWITYSGLIGLFTTRLPVFQWKARGYDWSLVDSIGQPSNLFHLFPILIVADNFCCQFAHLLNLWHVNSSLSSSSAFSFRPLLFSPNLFFFFRQLNFPAFSGTCNDSVSARYVSSLRNLMFLTRTSNNV